MQMGRGGGQDGVFPHTEWTVWNSDPLAFVQSSQGQQVEVT